jgi:hypothetical protein
MLSDELERDNIFILESRYALLKQQATKVDENDNAITTF